jgi:cell division protein FtsZ
MTEINDIAKLISENADPSAKIIFGTYYDRKLKKGQIKVTLVATGFDGAINGKNNALLPGLFNSRSDLPIIDDDVPKDFGEENGGGGQKKKKQEEPKKDKAEKKEEEIWDIPTFLRKKKKN